MKGAKKPLGMRQLGPKQRKWAELMADQMGLGTPYWVRTHGRAFLPSENAIEDRVLTMTPDDFRRWVAIEMQRKLQGGEPDWPEPRVREDRLDR